MQIRQLGINDALLWKKYRLEALKLHPENYLSSYEEEILLTDEDWKKRITQHEIFGLFKGVQLVATVCFSVMERYKNKHKGEIWGVYTLASERGQGYSICLMQHVLRHAQKKVKLCLLTCTTTNVVAFHIYQKLGFKVYGIEPKSIQVGKDFFDENLMILQF